MTTLIWLMLATFIIPILWAILTGRSKFRRRASFLADYIQKRGYVLLNPSTAGLGNESLESMVDQVPRGGFIPGNAGITDIEYLDRGTDSAALSFVCRLRGKEVTIFNFGGSPPLNAGSSGLNFKVAKIKQDGLPRFSLCRHSAVEAFQKVTDRLVGAPSLNLDAAADPAFAKHYWLKGPDSASVYSFLSAEKRRFLEGENLAGTLAANAQYLVYYEYGLMRTEQDYDRFIAVVDGLIAHLL